MISKARMVGENKSLRNLCDCCKCPARGSVVLYIAVDDNGIHFDVLPHECEVIPVDVEV